MFHQTRLIFVFLLEMGILHVCATGLKLLTSWSTRLSLPKCWDYRLPSNFYINFQPVLLFVDLPLPPLKLADATNYEAFWEFWGANQVPAPLPPLLAHDSTLSLIHQFILVIWFPAFHDLITIISFFFYSLVLWFYDLWKEKPLLSFYFCSSYEIY